MANYQTAHAQERRIQELDQTVESIFDVRKVSQKVRSENGKLY